MQSAQPLTAPIAVCVKAESGGGGGCKQADEVTVTTRSGPQNAACRRETNSSWSHTGQQVAKRRAAVDKEQASV